MATKNEKKILRLEKAERRKAERALKLKAFQSIDGPWDMIAYIMGYSNRIIVASITYTIGYVMAHYGVVAALLKKFGIIGMVVK